MRVDFAAWFFGQVLTEEFLGQTVSWGPDLMWCGAAHAFNGMYGPKSLSPCSLVSVNIQDKDTEQIEKGSHNGDFHNQGNAVKERFQSNKTFSSWMSASLPLSPKRFRLGDVLDWCKRKKFPHKSKSECGIARAESAVVVYNDNDGRSSVDPILFSNNDSVKLAENEAELRKN